MLLDTHSAPTELGNLIGAQFYNHFVPSGTRAFVARVVTNSSQLLWRRRALHRGGGSRIH